MTQLLAVFGTGIIISLIKGVQGCESIVEKGQRIDFQCIFQSNQNSITWQAVIGNNAVNLTTCNLASRVCRDQQPSVYNGRVISSVSGNYTISLDIKSVRINETAFRCVTNHGDVSDECKLRVYKWPSIPTGSVEITRSYVELHFSAFYYPSIQARLFRRESALTNDDIQSSHCNIRQHTSDPNGDYQAVCAWRIPMARMLLSSTLYVQMTLQDASDLQLNRSAVVSEDKLVQLGTVTVELVNCPAGPYVNGTVILKGKSATCTCKVTTSGTFLTGQAQWYTAYRRILQVENPREGVSILTVSFNPSDPNAIYECRGINPTREYQFIRYQPEFTVKMTSGSITNEIQTKLILFLLLMWTGLASKLV